LAHELIERLRDIEYLLEKSAYRYALPTVMIESPISMAGMLGFV